MNQQKHVKSSSLFLLELIFSILFFSLASAVCVQIFVKAHVMSETSRALNFAVNECSGMAELTTTCENPEEISVLLAQLYSLADLTNFPKVNLYYDSTFKPCIYSEAKYQLCFELSDISKQISDSAPLFSTYEARISFEDLDANTSIYSLCVQHHIPQEVTK